jgi:hypothetical protein
MRAALYYARVRPGEYCTHGKPLVLPLHISRGCTHVHSSPIRDQTTRRLILPRFVKFPMIGIALSVNRVNDHGLEKRSPLECLTEERQTRHSFSTPHFITHQNQHSHPTRQNPTEISSPKYYKQFDKTCPGLKV